MKSLWEQMADWILENDLQVEDFDGMDLARKASVRMAAEIGGVDVTVIVRHIHRSYK